MTCHPGGDEPASWGPGGCTTKVSFQKIGRIGFVVAVIVGELYYLEDHPIR